ncbi:hypothetical protein B0H13DRAFT_1955121 [Mycena leptocephala]|nr:hypothetical protein B0H13DRAFT_1955121 [Mycena leptocephala]
MSVHVVEPPHDIAPATKRSPTQRHMHNYSLPSPFSAERRTIRQPLRCQSSPALSEFRQAVYIPDTNLHETKYVPVKNGSPRAPRHARKSSRVIGAVEVGGTSITCGTASLRAAGSDPGISLRAYNHVPLSLTAAVAAKNADVSSLPFSSVSPPPNPSSNPHGTSTSRPSTSPATAVKAKIDRLKLNRLSTISIASLPFPLPTPPGLGSDVEWELDPFASSLPSKWSPASSALSLAHRATPSDTAPKSDHNAINKLKGASPTRLKEFLTRLSLNRSPATSGFHFRSSSTSKDGEVQDSKSRRPDSRMTFIADEENGGQKPLIEDMSTQNDDADILGTPTPISLILKAGQQDVCSVDADALDTGDIDWNSSLLEFSVVPLTRPLSTATIPISTQTSIAKYTDDNSIIASVGNTLSGRFHASTSSPSPTMRAPISDALATSSNLTTSLPSNSRPKTRSNQSRSLTIPPSPLTPPPHPPNSLPSSECVARVFDFDFPSPAKSARLPPSPSLAAGETEMPLQHIPPPSPSSRRLPYLPKSFEGSLQNPNFIGCTVAENRPPAVPPRSKLRPPPVKIPSNFSSMHPTIRPRNEVSGQCNAFKPGSPAHSRSSSIASLTISPLSTPPTHSHSSSIASLTISPLPTPPMHSSFASVMFTDSPKPVPPQHSHSSSVASSFMISPMPTPPSLSPISPSSTSIQSPLDLSPIPPPCARPGTPEPKIDMDLLRKLIFEDDDFGQNSSESDNEHESEVGESLEAIARAHRSIGDERRDSSAGTTSIPEFAWQEEPRAPPSRMSFYRSPSPERIHPSSDIEDDAVSIYSQFSSKYTFRSRSNGTRRLRSVRRNGTKGRSRRMAAMSMMSVYSQSSFTSRDTMDLPSVPTLPWGLTSDSIGGATEDLPDNDLGEMVFEAPEYAYAFSWDDYVGHGLEGVALAGRAPPRSGANFEAELPFSRRAGKPDFVASTDSAEADWRALLTGPDKGKSKRRTSSNISIVGNVVTITGGSASDVSTTSTLPLSPRGFVPNRRQRTIRRVTTTLPSSPSSYQPPSSSTSVNFIFDAEDKNGGWRREMSPGDTERVPSVGPQEKLKPPEAFVRTAGDEEPRQRVEKPSCFSHPSIISLSNVHTFPPRSPVSHDRPPIPASWPATLISPTVSSHSSGSASAPPSLPSSASSSWTPGLTGRGDASLLSPTEAPSTIAMAI